jgi:hypothetical protein
MPVKVEDKPERMVQGAKNGRKDDRRAEEKLADIRSAAIFVKPVVDPKSHRRVNIKGLDVRWHDPPGLCGFVTGTQSPS